MTFDSGVTNETFDGDWKKVITDALLSLLQEYNFNDTEIKLSLKNGTEKVVCVTFNRKLKDGEAATLKEKIVLSAFREDFNKEIENSVPGVKLELVSAISK